MGAEISALLGFGNLLTGMVPMGIGLLDRARLQNDPFIQEAIRNAAGQANAIGGADVFGPQMAAIQQLMGQSPTANLMGNYQQLLGSAPPPLVDSTAGMSNLLGRPSTFNPTTGPQTNPQFMTPNVQNIGTPTLPQTPANFDPNQVGTFGGPDLSNILSHLFGGGGYGGGAYGSGGGGGGYTPPTNTYNPGGWPGGTKPPPAGQQTLIPKADQAQIQTTREMAQPTASPTATYQQTYASNPSGSKEGGYTPPVAQVQQPTAQVQQQPASTQPNLYQQVLQNPQSMGQDIQDLIFRQGNAQMQQGQQDMLRRMRNEGNAAGTLGTGNMQRQFFDANQQGIQRAGDLRSNIGIEAARTNFDDLLRSAGLQVGAEGQLAQQQLAQNALQQQAYQQNFGNQARVFQDAYTAQGQEQQRLMELIAQMTGIPLQQQGLQNDAISRLINMRLGQLTPSVFGGGVSGVPYNAGGGSGGGGELERMLGAFAGYGMGGGFNFGSF